VRLWSWDEIRAWTFKTMGWRWPNN
jgi:hypothetical protein